MLHLPDVSGVGKGLEGEYYGERFGKKGRGGGRRDSRGDEAGKQIAQNEVTHYLPADSDSGENSRRGKKVIADATKSQKQEWQNARTFLITTQRR